MLDNKEKAIVGGFVVVWLGGILLSLAITILVIMALAKYVGC